MLCCFALHFVRPLLASFFLLSSRIKACTVYVPLCLMCSAQDNLAKAQATYGTGSCFLLHTNSRQPGSVVLGENPWSRLTLHSTTGEVCTLYTCTCKTNFMLYNRSRLWYCIVLFIYRVDDREIYMKDMYIYSTCTCICIYLQCTYYVLQFVL